MKYPRSRAERRHNGVTWRERQRKRMLTWVGYRLAHFDGVEENLMWWARKQCSAHGNRCMCHYEKRCRKYIRKRRRALDQEIEFNIRSWE